MIFNKIQNFPFGRDTDKYRESPFSLRVKSSAYIINRDTDCVPYSCMAAYYELKTKRIIMYAQLSKEELRYIDKGSISYLSDGPVPGKHFFKVKFSSNGSKVQFFYVEGGDQLLDSKKEQTKVN